MCGEKRLDTKLRGQKGGKCFKSGFLQPTAVNLTRERLS